MFSKISVKKIFDMWPSFKLYREAVDSNKIESTELRIAIHSDTGKMTFERAIHGYQKNR